MKIEYKSLIHSAVAILILLICNCCSDGSYFEDGGCDIPVVTTGTAFCNPPFSVTLNLDIVSSGTDYWVDYGFYYSNFNKIPAEGDYVESSTTTDASGYFSIYLFGSVTPGILYYYRAFAKNCSHTGYGETRAFTFPGNITGEIHFNPELDYGSLADVDGNIYKTIVIGSQKWMAENLKTTRYNDNTDIPEILEAADWIGRSVPGFSYYINDPGTFSSIYGALYNWHALNTGKLCPSGWHVPGDAEWITLTLFLGGDSIAAAKLMETDTTHWVYSAPEISNSSGFTALPAGLRNGYSAFFDSMGFEGYFWSSTNYPDTAYGFNGAWMRKMYSGWKGFDRNGISKSTGLSVRCVED